MKKLEFHQNMPNLETSGNLVELISCMTDKWPSVFVAREKVGLFTGGAISPTYQATLDCLGLGPERIRLHRKIIYKTDVYARWFLTRGAAIVNPTTHNQQKEASRKNIQNEENSL